MEHALRLLQGSPNGISCENFPPACITDISTLLNIIIPLIYIGAALLMLGILVMAGMTYIRAKGDPANTERAKNMITFSVLGIIVVIVAFFATRLIASLLGIPFIL